MPTDDSHDQMHHDFEELELEEQAQFLIKASASTLARGIEQIGQVLADGLEDVMHRSHRSPGAPGTSGPETAQQQAPKNGSSPET